MAKVKHAKKAIKQRGEVFTPTKLVYEMLHKIPWQTYKNPDKTFLDNSCGNGQFLFAVMELKMWWLMKGDKMPLYQAHKKALSTIYGVEIDPQNAEDCRRRLLNGSQSKELRAIVDHNIITADALDPEHEGWKEVGFYWSKDDPA